MDKDKFNDRSYKLLFSHPRMVEDLIKSFVKEDFVDKIDYNTLKPVKTSFVSSTFKGRETDVIWSVNIEEKQAYIYILIDFQSTVDKFMSLRLISYIGLFYEHLLKKRKKKGHIHMLLENLEKFEKETYKKGRKIGLQEGMQKGMQKGTLHGKLDVARKMVNDGFPLEDVVKYTGLMMENIKDLMKS